MVRRYNRCIDASISKYPTAPGFNTDICRHLVAINKTYNSSA